MTLAAWDLFTVVGVVTSGIILLLVLLVIWSMLRSVFERRRVRRGDQPEADAQEQTPKG